MKFFFNLLTSLSLRFRWLTLVMVVLLLVLGVIAWNDLNQELLPPIEFPQTVILAQASGMSSEQVLTVLTERLEAELSQIDEIINLESQTTGAFGAVIIAYNDFGLDQQRQQARIQEALDRVWLPMRSIQPATGEDGRAFAAGLLRDLTPDVLIYLAERDSNFLFQLSPQVWDSFSDETVRALLVYLANQVETVGGGRSALERLVEKEIVPQLNSIDTVANVSVGGGQPLPGDEVVLTVAEEQAEVEAQSLLLRLSPDVWDVVATRAGVSGALDEVAVQALAADDVEIPVAPPLLPESWHRDHFYEATDLLEIVTLTNRLSGIFNQFHDSGRIVGALGRVDDLTPVTVTRVLEIEPSLVEYFTAEHLVAMSPDVFEVLPDTFIASLDGFSRDALAAAALAESITGEQAERVAPSLPDPWRIRPPSLITFSFADIPLASFSVSTTGVVGAAAGVEVVDAGPATNTGNDNDEPENSNTPADNPGHSQTNREIPEGPALAPIFAIIGTALGTELNTADDLIVVRLPEEFAEGVGIESLTGAQLLNFIVAPPDFSGAGEDVQAPNIPLNPAVLVGALSPEVVSFIAEYDPTFLPSLLPEVYDMFSDDVLALPEVSPPLADAWDELSGQPQFVQNPLLTAGDILAIGGGQASVVLNTINANVPAQFQGYEVRLFDSLRPGVVRYFLRDEPDFYTNLDVDVLRKFSPAVLANMPEEALAALDEDVAAELVAIAQGEQNSAFAALQELYTVNIAPADPNAPALNPAWPEIASFYGIELDTADDFFRFPEGFPFPDAAAFINSIFENPQGAVFARNNNLMSGLPIEAVEYIVARDVAVLNDLNAEPLQLMTDEALALLPEALQQRAQDGGEVFTPLAQVTRTNLSPSLLVTVFKDADANTVSTYAEVDRLLRQVDADNPDIAINVVFEQSSFIEDSIEGVAREGGLGAVFAIIIILVFLSSGTWNMSGRRLVGMIMVVVFLLLLGLLVFSGLDAAGGDLGRAFAESDVIFRVLLIVGVIAGVVVLLWPGNLPDPAWRATVVIAVSIPLSILTAFVGMRWFSPFMHDLIRPLAEDSTFFTFVLRLFPDELTLNIMTLSGLTVAVGRVVDDSIVVLENIFRQVQAGGDKREAVLSGTRDVSAAIFTATLIAVVVFLPLGLTGGIIGAFFLPFGLAVTYALAGSFLVAVTVVPPLAYIMINPDDVPEEGDIWLARYYLPVLRWALSSWTTRFTVLGLAILSMFFGFFLLSQRPAAFLPNFGEPQVSISVQMPPSTRILEVNQRVQELEQFLVTELPSERVTAIQTVVGGGGASFETLLVGSSVSENRANLTIGLDVNPQELNDWTQRIRDAAEGIFGEENVQVSAASIAESGFGGFALVVSGPVEELVELDPIIIETLNDIEGITNVSSNFSAAETGEGGPITYIRVNQESAVSYSAELETENTIGVTQQAIAIVRELPELSENISVSQGYQSEIQTQGFNSLPIAMGIAVMIVIVILIFSFGSLVYWLAIILSIVVAPVGAAIALTLTNRVLGISAMIGLLMLLGLVVTNAVVLIDRVRSNRVERGMPLYDALVEAGGRRLRPILMTSLATIIALTPLTIGLSEGAIIASELGTVVIGGVFSSTLLTLIVVPVAYSLFNPIHRWIVNRLGGKAD